MRHKGIVKNAVATVAVLGRALLLQCFGSTNGLLQRVLKRLRQWQWQHVNAFV